uniref:Uncharacterized protein n=1 Tax=Arundo donax TaxID=35708 RepID=A0A0A9ATP2_ARUDO
MIYLCYLVTDHSTATSMDHIIQRVSQAWTAFRLPLLNLLLQAAGQQLGNCFRFNLYVLNP